MPEVSYDALVMAAIQMKAVLLGRVGLRPGCIPLSERIYFCDDEPPAKVGMVQAALGIALFASEVPGLPL